MKWQHLLTVFDFFFSLRRQNSKLSEIKQLVHINESDPSFKILNHKTVYFTMASKESVGALRTHVERNFQAHRLSSI